jgi:hypothetical protein
MEVSSMLKDYQIKQIGLFSALGIDKRVELSCQLNQFYQERIETLRTRLWGTLTWLAAAQAAALSLAIKVGGLRTISGGIAMQDPVVVVLLALFGIAFAIFMITVIRSGNEHLASNMRSSNFALNLPYIMPYVGGTNSSSAGSGTTPPAEWSKAKSRAKCQVPDAEEPLKPVDIVEEPTFKIMRKIAWSALVLEIVILVVGVLGVAEWLCKDIPYISITAFERGPS